MTPERLEEIKAKNVILTAENKRLREDLEKYGQHKTGWGACPGGDNCICGFSDALKKEGV